MKKILAILVSTVLLCTLVCGLGTFSASASEAVTYSQYKFNGGAYANTGSDDQTTKTGVEVGTFTANLGVNAWIGDHLGGTAASLSKGGVGTGGVEVPNSALTMGTSFTVGAWFACAHVDERSNSGAVQRIISNGGYGTTPGYFIGVLVQNDGKTYIGYNIGGSAGVTDFVLMLNPDNSNNVYLGNAWNHIALAVDGAAQKAYLYLNGALLKTIDTTISVATLNTAAEKAYIGCYKDGSSVTEGFCGYINDVQAVNRVLTADQIEGYVGRGVTSINACMADSFLISSIAVTTDPTKTAYTEDDSFDPAGMVVTATMKSGETVPVTGYTYTQKVPADGIIGIDYEGFSTDLPVSVTGKPPVQEVNEWKYNDNGFVHFTFDGRKAENGTELKGAVKFTAGRSGKDGDYSAQLDGASYLELDAAHLSFDKSFSVSFWTKMNSGSSTYNAVQRIFSTGVWGAGEGGFAVGIYNCKQSENWTKVISGVGSGSPALNWTDATELWDDDTWHHIAATFDASTKTVKVYVDCALAGTYAYPTDGSTVTGYLKTAIGGHLDSTGAFAEGFKGELDDVFVINRAISGKEVAALYNTNTLEGDFVLTGVNSAAIWFAAVSVVSLLMLLGGCFILKRRVKE